ncbi:MAG: type I DNA topoisomerase [Bdellovibrionia bacterium]
MAKQTAKAKAAAKSSAKTPASNMKTLVIVESPTKAKTIRKFLGRNYIVESSMGHIRDLPQSAKDIPEKIKKQSWGHLGVNVEKDFDPVYLVPKNKTKVVKNLQDKLLEADELILATDEDREGESISWHLLEVLKPKVPVKRMVFHEITKEAIEEAQKKFRDINFNLVRAQEARRILDRLVGYTISPLIWKKVAYGLSAGRVQSVAVKLICERELERMRFKKADYWSVSAELTKGSNPFEARILSLKDRRIAIGKDFDPETGEIVSDKQKEVLRLDEKQANQLKKDLLKEDWRVVEVEEKPVSRKPAPPFITSTLQQEANRKLGMGAKEAMRVAQSLYEQGFITYMRTDSVSLSEQAVKAARASIEVLYGKEYLPPAPRTFTHKQPKGAQEAHEAIRPAGTVFVSPEKTKLKAVELKLYELIWKRTVACQMVDSKQKQVSVRLKAGDAIFAASGMTIEFPGFLKAYEEGRDDAEDDKGQKLPALKEGDKIACQNLIANAHETKPPARFTEASLIQTMEKEGIGRPSTYAPTIGTIVDRGYVRKIGPALSPTFTALVVNKMLSRYLPQYVDTNFTSKMEDSLDEISGGELEMVEYLKTIYSGKNGLEAQVKKQEKTIDADEARSIKFDALPGYDVRVGRYGAYICRMDKTTKEEVCASLPEGQAPADVSVQVVEKLIEQKIHGADALGKDPGTGKPIYVLTGRFGPYVQLGDVGNEKEKVKRVSIPPHILPETVDMKISLELLSLPKTLGAHPGTSKDVKVGLGRFGPFVVHDGDYRSVPKTENFLDTTFERAMELLSQPKKGRGRASALKELGAHPKDGEKISVFNGKYGPYIKWGKVNVSLPEDQKPESVTLAQALKLIDAKDGDSTKKKPKGKSRQIAANG